MAFKHAAQGACALAAAAAISTAAHAATVTLVTTDAIGQSSFVTDSLSHWNPAGDPVAGNDYVVPGGAAGVLSLRTPADSGSLTFAGSTLTLGNTGTYRGVLVLKNLTASTITIDNLTLNNGEIQNGATSTGAATTVTIAGNGITLTSAGGTLNSGTGGRVLEVSAPISGTGGITVMSGGMVILSGTNSHQGPTTVTGGVLRASSGVGLPSTSNLVLNGGVLENGSGYSGDLGAGAGQVQLTGGVSGFSANGADAVVAIGGTASPTALTWGAAGFAPTTLVLNAASATNALEFRNAIDLGASARTIAVNAQTTTLSGVLSGSGALTKSGGGTLVVSNASNSLTGAISIGVSGSGTRIGVLRATASGALGSGVVTIGPGGNDATARLELAGGITLANQISLPGRNNTTVAIQSNGNNTLSNRIDSASGGSGFIIQSDAGVLTLSGTADAGGVSIQSTGGTRTFTLQGVGDGVVSGIIQNGTGTSPLVAITKAGAGTWTLSGNNSYTGTTTITGGTLALGASNRLADTAPLSLGGGTFATGGFSESAGTVAMTASSAIDLGAGASSLAFANSSALTWTGTLTVNNWTSGVDHLFVGADATGLSSTQLAQIQFSGYGAGAQILSTGEVLPIPEPATMGVLALAGLVLARRRYVAAK